nr:MAG: hypothetical protein [Caudoviricetes sp.]
MYTVGQEVGIIRYGSWDHIQNQGIYTVTKSNKQRVHLVRNNDGYERIFSVITGKEKGSGNLRPADIITVNEYNRILERKRKEEEIRATWRAIQSCADKKDLEGLKAAIAVLEEV